MFSPDVSVTSSGHNLRSKRSRRQGSEESFKLPLAKKRRSALRKDTFEPIDDVSLANDDAYEVKANKIPNGHAPEENPGSEKQSSRSAELTIRGGKKTERRGEKSDGSFILSSNDYYTVSQLPALPDQIRSHSSTIYSSFIAPENGYALALTHSHAVIWPYNSQATVPPSKDVFSFSLPFSIPNSDPLPLAAFSAKSATGEPGLVIVTPSKGKIAFWETISSASSLVAGSQSHGIQGSVPGMLSGETITSIENAEPAGFVLTFSQGRVAHLTLKDQLGRPAIGVQFLRKPSNATQNGIFGSIRNVFAGGGRKSVAAAHAGRASRGQRDVIIATADGELECWDSRLNVGDTLKCQMSAKEDLLDSLRHNLPAEHATDYHFEVIDFTFSTKYGDGRQIVKPEDQVHEELAFLVALTHANRSAYYIIEATVSVPSVQVHVVHPVTCYKTSLRSESLTRTRLYIPKPGQTAFIVFENAIVLFSLVRVQESPSSQLLIEGGSLPEPFQDCIRFQENSSFQVLDSAPEDIDDNHKHSSCILSIQSFGIVRISAAARRETAEDALEVKVTAKTKIEQAVFFGGLRNNPLDLTGRGEEHFSPEDIESAALEISQEILTSSSKYLPKASPSVEQNLRSRAKALEDLAIHVSQRYNPLTRPARFQLLWDAEKLAAQRSLWNVQEAHRKRRPKEEDTVLQNILFYLHPDSKTQIDPSKGENDRIRQWFTYDGNRVQNIMLWLHHIHGELYKDEVIEPKPVAENLLETMELSLAMWDTAYRFREDHAGTYGLGDETFKEGVLVAGYGDLALPWTCSEWSRLVYLARMSNEFARKWWINEQKPSPEHPDPSTIRKIGSLLPRQTEMMCRIILERAKWFQAQDSEKMRDDAKKLMTNYVNNSRQQLLSMAGLGFSDEAIKLAEKLEDMEILVELNIDVLIQLNESSPDTQSSKEIDRLEREAQKVHDRMNEYFSRFKARWAHAYYEKLVQEGQLGSLLSEEEHQPFLTAFLRRNPKYGKISWINDIIGQKSYSRAATTLLSVAENQETDHWSKKVELCLGKLATLATVEVEAKSNGRPSEPSESQILQLSTTTSSIKLLDLQNQLYTHVASLIGRNYLDNTSRIENAFELLGKSSPALDGKPAFKGLLYDGLGLLMRHESMTVEQLVDVLTLMSSISFDDAAVTEETLDASVLGSEFFFALKAIDFALPPGNEEATMDQRTKREALQKQVWRRALVRDDWLSLNKTEGRTESEVHEAMKATATWATSFHVLEEDITNELAVSTTSKSTFKSTNKEKHRPIPSFIPVPSEICTNPEALFPEILRQRFAPQEIELIRKDLEAENEQLRTMVENARLDQWFGGLLKDARAEIEAVLDSDGRAGLLRQGEKSGDLGLGGENNGQAQEGDAADSDKQQIANAVDDHYREAETSADAIANGEITRGQGQDQSQGQSQSEDRVEDVEMQEVQDDEGGARKVRFS